MPPYERFLAYQRAHALALAIYRSTGRWPPNERYGLTAQLRKCAFSVGANLAEGSAKRGPREFRRFLDVALGSLSELAYGLQLARDLGLITGDEWHSLDGLRDETGKLVWGLYRSMKAVGR